MRRSLPIISNHVKTLQSTQKNFHVQHRLLSKQTSLPRLPVPPLKQTLDLYLRYVQPLLDSSMYAQTVHDVDNFLNKPDQGPVLQQHLQNRAKRTDNWLSKWWLDVAYLDCRLPVVINVNPGVRFPERKFSSNSEWLDYSARLVWGVLDFKTLIDNENLPVERMGGEPLCMMQYYSCLNSCRIPGYPSDTTVTYKPDDPSSPGHIVVAFKNRFYRVSAYNTVTRRPLPLSVIRSQLHSIIQDKRPPAQDALGLMTSEHRDIWCKTYKRLTSEPVNCESFEIINSGVFMLCLDQPLKLRGGRRDDVSAQNMLHGCGSTCNSANRWFDKTVQFIVTQDGSSGLNYEHAPAEGPPVVSIVDHAAKLINKLDIGSDGDAGQTFTPTELKFVLDEETRADMKRAAQRLDDAVDDLQATVLTFTDFGKNLPKKNRISPDAFIQVALQLAYSKLYSKSAPTYESGSLRKFQLGRTETIRSCSPESVNFCQLMRPDSTATHGERLTAMRAAVLAHRTYTNLAINGKGFDRHLLGLKLTALEINSDPEKLPPFLQSDAYQRSLHFQLSTSQVPSSAEASLLFGPVVPDGYGFCYNPQEHVIHIVVTAYKSCDSTDSVTLADAVQSSLRDMAALLTDHHDRAKL